MCLDGEDGMFFKKHLFLLKQNKHNVFAALSETKEKRGINNSK